MILSQTPYEQVTSTALMDLCAPAVGSSPARKRHRWLSNETSQVLGEHLSRLLTRNQFSFKHVEQFTEAYRLFVRSNDPKRFFARLGTHDSVELLEGLSRLKVCLPSIPLFINRAIRAAEREASPTSPLGIVTTILRAGSEFGPAFPKILEKVDTHVLTMLSKKEPSESHVFTFTPFLTEYVALRKLVGAAAAVALQEAILPWTNPFTNDQASLYPNSLAMGSKIAMSLEVLGCKISDGFRNHLIDVLAPKASVTETDFEFDVAMAFERLGCEVRTQVSSTKYPWKGYDLHVVLPQGQILMVDCDGPTHFVVDEHQRPLYFRAIDRVSRHCERPMTISHQRFYAKDFMGRIENEAYVHKILNFLARRRNLKDL